MVAWCQKLLLKWLPKVIFFFVCLVCITYNIGIRIIGGVVLIDRHNNHQMDAQRYKSLVLPCVIMLTSSVANCIFRWIGRLPLNIILMIYIPTNKWLSNV